MRFTLIAAALLLAACGQPSDPTAAASTDAPEAPISGPAESPAESAPAATKSLPARLDCLRETGGLLLIGHRGGPRGAFPENAIETFERTFKAGTRAMEVDIAETKDGKLVLMHDDELDRTTTGTGLVADHTLAEIQALNLRAAGKPTDFHAPTLEAALEWAVKTGAFLELDKKRSASYGPIIAAIRAAKAENNVLLITYTDDQAVEVHKLAPELVITATIDTMGEFHGLVERGVNPQRLLAWTGVTEPRPQLWKELAEIGVESVFGTTGPRDTAYDTLYWNDDNGAEYNTLAANGLAILVTGLTDKTSRQLGKELAKGKACGF